MYRGLTDRGGFQIGLRPAAEALLMIPECDRRKTSTNREEREVDEITMNIAPKRKIYAIAALFSICIVSSSCKELAEESPVEFWCLNLTQCHQDFLLSAGEAGKQRYIREHGGDAAFRYCVDEAFHNWDVAAHRCGKVHHTLKNYVDCATRSCEELDACIFYDEEKGNRTACPCVGEKKAFAKAYEACIAGYENGSEDGDADETENEGELAEMEIEAETE